MGKSSWKTPSCYLLWHPWGVLCPWEPAWLFHGVLNPRISHLRGVLDSLESAACWLGFLENMGGVLRCCSFFGGG